MTCEEKSTLPYEEVYASGLKDGFILGYRAMPSADKDVSVTPVSAPSAPSVSYAKVVHGSMGGELTVYVHGVNVGDILHVIPVTDPNGMTFTEVYDEAHEVTLVEEEAMTGPYVRWNSSYTGFHCGISAWRAVVYIVRNGVASIPYVAEFEEA